MFEIPKWSHHNPVRVVSSSINELPRFTDAERVLLVTTPGFVKRGAVEQILDRFSDRSVEVWARVQPNPDLADLDAATESLRSLNVGCVVGLGGGSALDTAKVLATTLTQSRGPTLKEIFRHEVKATWGDRLPLIVVPTTSGTGAEVTPFATVWDHDQQAKHSFSGESVYPDLALLDPTLTLTLGTNDTLYPALDSISHALESLWNVNKTPISQMHAFQALSLVNEALLAVITDPHSLALRSKLQTASLLSGLAISQTKTAIAHAISYPLTSRFGVPHGLACSFTLPALINENIGRIVTSKNEEEVLQKTFSVLSQLEISSHLGNYLPKEADLSFVKAVLHPGRISNYINADNPNVDSILEKSI